MIDLFPDVLNVISVYKVSPCWCLTHHLVQAATILLLKLSLRAEHVPIEAAGVLASAKKAVFWLNHVADEGAGSQRARAHWNGMLRIVALKIGGDEDDMPAEPPHLEVQSDFVNSTLPSSRI